MLKVDCAIYTGDEKPLGYVGYITRPDFFLLLEVEEGIDRENGQEILKDIQSAVVNFKVKDLASFEQFIVEEIKKTNPPANFSLVAGLLEDEILYLKTEGSGQVNIFRNNKLSKLIEGGNSASGYVKNEDLIVFSAQGLTSYWDKDGELRNIFSTKNIQSITSNLKLTLNTLLVYFQEQDERLETILSEPEVNADYEEIEMEEKTLMNETALDSQDKLSKLKEMLSHWAHDFRVYSQAAARKKMYTFFAIIILFLILVWSVGLGYTRRSQDLEMKKIKSVKDLVVQKLAQSSDVAFLNLPRSLALIEEAKNEVGKLKKEVGKKNLPEIAKIELLISQQEDTVIKKEEKQPEEFYDLAVDRKEATGQKLYLAGEILAILDRNNGTIYKLSLAKKSLDKKQSAKIKLAKIVGLFDDKLFYIVDGDGVYRVEASGEEKKVIDWDKNWVDLAGIWIFNGNLYILDRGKEVYKYLPTADGYSAKSSYFQSGQAINLKDSNSIAIDSSLYIGLSDRVVKYTAGNKDDFTTAFPQQNPQLVKIFTSSNVEKVYGWDKKRGEIYILGKNGTYERQIDSSILKSSNDFVVLGDSAYVLKGSKIYKINLN